MEHNETGLLLFNIYCTRTLKKKIGQFDEFMASKYNDLLESTELNELLASIQTKVVSFERTGDVDESAEETSSQSATKMKEELETLRDKVKLFEAQSDAFVQQSRSLCRIEEDLVESIAELDSARKELSAAKSRICQLEKQVAEANGMIIFAYILISLLIFFSFKNPSSKTNSRICRS